MEILEPMYMIREEEEVDKELVKDHLGKISAHQSMGLDWFHPRALRGLAEEIAKSLSIISASYGEWRRFLNIGG